MPVLTIVRGLPGSAKSTYAKTFGCFMIEADMFFVTEGSYTFDPKLIGRAHEFCKNMVTQAMLYKVDIVVSNTHCSLWEMNTLFDLAKCFNYTVKVVRCTGNYGNTHGVPEETIERMKERFEDYEGETII